MNKLVFTKSKIFYNTGCPIDLCIDVLKGKCKAAIVLGVNEGNNRFSMLKKKYKISERMLARQLEELQKDGILQKETLRTYPMEVIYSLTDVGRQLCPMIGEMYRWGIHYRNLEEHAEL